MLCYAVRTIIMQLFIWDFADTHYITSILTKAYNHLQYCDLTNIFKNVDQYNSGSATAANYNVTYVYILTIKFKRFSLLCYSVMQPCSADIASQYYVLLARWSCHRSTNKLIVGFTFNSLLCLCFHCQNIKLYTYDET